ncbi:MAG TPA: hypothetical protein VGH14_20380 [Solirubrobacterales bacterium]|jgi:hypothetical protein
MKFPELKRPDLRRGRLRAGPEVRMPDFIVDLYADLRDRRLLPLVVLLLVTIVAAPILIGGSTKAQRVAPIASAQSAVDTASFSVVPAATGLQEYKKRLAHRRSVNPFDPFAATKHPTPTRSELQAIEVAKSEPVSGAPESEVAAGRGGAPAENSPTESGPTTTTMIEKPKVVKATLKAQVGVAAVLKAGFNGSGLEEVEIEDQTRLPQNKPAIVYNGTSKKGGALFLMTSQVSEFSGEGHCVLGSSLCQVVELKIGQAETLAIGYGETRYTVRLVGFKPIVKEEVIETEGRKVRVPNHHGRNSQGRREGNGTPEGVGTEPSPRWLLR